MKQIRSKAPLRIGFSGGGTDVSPYSDLYGGAVLNATLDMYAYCYITATEDRYINMKSRDYETECLYPASENLPIDGILDLFKYIYNHLVATFHPPITGFQLVTYSDAPYGSGLGGSSTLVVSIIQAFAQWWRLPLGEYDIAQLAYKIEREEASLKGGKQDQYAASFGGFNYMEFFKDRVIVNPLRIKPKIINELQSSLLLCFTGRSRESAHIIDTQIKNVGEKNTTAVEAMHQVKKDAFDMKEAILTGRLDNFSKILDRAWQNKKQMASTISNLEIESLYEFAKSHGANAGKISGAGGGGFIMFSVDPINKYDLKKALIDRGHDIKEVRFTQAGVQSWTI